MEIRRHLEMGVISYTKQFGSFAQLLDWCVDRMIAIGRILAGFGAGAGADVPVDGPAESFILLDSSKTETSYRCVPEAKSKCMRNQLALLMWMHTRNLHVLSARILLGTI